MDFSQVRAITIPEGSVNRILSGATVLWKKTGGLPTGYQQVEYIESSGTQYIDLPFGFDDTDTIETRFSIDTSMRSDKYINSPETWNNNTNRFGMGVHEATNSGYCVGFGGRTTNNTFLSPRTQNDGEFHTWTYSNRFFLISDLGCSLDVSNATFGGTTANLRLFYGYNAPTKCRIASYHHTKTRAEYNLVPCYRKSDSVAGLYDMVNNVFYTNAGTGSFAVGPEIISLPSEYQQVACIESDGSQYIDTGVIGKTGLHIVTEMGYATLTSATTLFGSRDPRFFVTLYPSTTIDIGYNNDNSTGINAESRKIYNIDFDTSTSPARFGIDGSYITSNNQVDTNRNIYIFGCNRNGAVAALSESIFKSMTITDENGGLLRKFVPCYRIADGEIGLYDLVSATFFTNSGSGTFSKGADVT